MRGVSGAVPPHPAKRMTALLIALTALLASVLSFFTGFGLTTMLQPVMLAVFPAGQAVAMTALVHLLNGLLKAALVGRHADMGTVWRFGLPAALAALAGAWLLSSLLGLPVLAEWRLGGWQFAITPVKLAIGVLLLLSTLAEFLPGSWQWRIRRRHLVLGGLLSGFFGGLSGHQGALRSAFLLRAGLGKEAFIATNAVISAIIDIARLIFYTRLLTWENLAPNTPLLTAALLASFAGVFAGQYLLGKTTLASVQRIVAIVLILMALGLISGII